MKTLILFRHGKAERTSASGQDHDRLLAARGRAASQAMGEFLTRTGQAPDSVLTSSALRARSTAELALEAGRWSCPVRVTGALYEASSFQVLSEIRAEPGSTERLLLSGHEPTWSELTGLLVGGGQIYFPTACMARVDFDLDSWQEVEYGAGLLIWHVPPRLLMEGEIDPFE